MWTPTAGTCTGLLLLLVSPTGRPTRLPSHQKQLNLVLSLTTARHTHPVVLPRTLHRSPSPSPLLPKQQQRLLLLLLLLLVLPPLMLPVAPCTRVQAGGAHACPLLLLLVLLLLLQSPLHLTFLPRHASLAAPTHTHQS
jgi:hypothetical protein